MSPKSVFLFFSCFTLARAANVALIVGGINQCPEGEVCNDEPEEVGNLGCGLDPRTKQLKSAELYGCPGKSSLVRYCVLLKT